MHTVEAGQAISIYLDAVSYLKLDNATLVVLYTWSMRERMIACLMVVSRRHLTVNWYS